ncbi:dienelactone hydrolase family protein [Halarcobacter anaerophilus]|uniref:Dienelactone hydrolase n=1 Tax=Halarcobacter anaerophilus TaxID=877500 RepID=A0A4Q0XX05_9BACT|nr:dienelactone hydrolase family protein [Halarcobacter anaerophilus]QDF30342.1 dienelactone hydrolase [Halarcobacter anaerophilus]RXJ61565.1 dienelactone hydrolase [Halarcobacter anaerophilus]
MKKILLSLVFFSSVLFSKEGFVTYKVDAKEYEAYISSPSKNAPLVFLVHDWDGLTDYEVKRAKMLNKMGYATFAVDLYGKGVRPEKLEDKKRLTTQLYKDREKMKTLLFAGLNEAKDQGLNVKNSLGIGYCFGGAAILEFARAGAELKKFVSFHGGLKTPKGEDYSKTKGDIVVFHGSADKVVSMQEFATLAQELEKAGIKHEMTSYSGAPHAFTVFGTKKYYESADKSSWRRFSEILEDTLKE